MKKFIIWFFVIALCLSNKVFLSIGLIYLCYKLYKKYFNERVNAFISGHSADPQPSMQEIRNRIAQTIYKYLTPYTMAWKTWPTKITLTKYDYASIRNLTEKEITFDTHELTEEQFNQIIDNQLLAAANALFCKNFDIKMYESIAPGRIFVTNSTLIEKYYDLFGMNKSYIPHLIHYSQRFPFPLEENEVIAELTEINRRIAIEKRSAAIEDSIMNNRPIVSNIDINYIDSLDGVAFEKVLGKLFESMGYAVNFTKVSGDQGADLLLSKGDELKIVQAKCYKDKVSNSAVQEAVATKAFYKYDLAAVATNSYFTQGAIELAEANGVELIDREKLIELLHVHPIPKASIRGE